MQNGAVDFYLWGAQTELEFLESRTIEHLDAGETATLSLTFIAPELSGSSSLLVLTEPDDLINELIESNNFASREFQVAADGIPMTYGFYSYLFVIEKDSDHLLQDTINWLDDMLLMSSSRTGMNDNHENDHHNIDHDNDDDSDMVNRLRELKEQLLKIGLMDKGDATGRDKVIDKVLHVLTNFDKLPVDFSAPRSWMSNYLRIMEVEYDLSGDYKKPDDGN